MRTSTPRRRNSCRSRPGGAVRFSPTPAKCNGSSTICLWNKLATGQIRASDGLRIDLRNIKSPIVCFCSWGDNITPPQQALDSVLDLYDNVDEIVANGQTIVYSLHHTIGHLGIFVSGKVALKEHREFVSCMEMIQAMPPGLYEATIVEVTDKTENGAHRRQVSLPSRGPDARRHPRLRRQ